MAFNRTFFREPLFCPCSLATLVGGAFTLATALLQVCA